MRNGIFQISYFWSEQPNFPSYFSFMTKFQCSFSPETTNWRAWKSFSRSYKFTQRGKCLVGQRIFCSQFHLLPWSKKLAFVWGVGGARARLSTSFAPSRHPPRGILRSLPPARAEVYCILFVIMERERKRFESGSRVCSGQGGPENELAMRHIRPRTVLFINSDPWVPSISLQYKCIIQTHTFIIYLLCIHMGFNDAQGMSPPLNPTVQFRAAKANTPFHLNYRETHTRIIIVLYSGIHSRVFWMMNTQSWIVFLQSIFNPSFLLHCCA